MGRRLEREVSVEKGEKRSEEENVLRRSMSAGVTYCVPATHWKFEIVGLGGMTASGLNNLSSDFDLQTISVRLSRASLKTELTVVDLYPRC